MSLKLELKKENYFSYMILSCGILTAVKLLCLYLVKVNLWVDEAQYWTWSKELAWGYYSKPPVISWLIYITTHVFGDNGFGIRFSAPIIHFLTAVFVYLTAKDLYNEKTGFFSAITYITLPAVTISSSFISTDAPLMLFWVASLYFLIHIIKINNSKGYWVAYAICVGEGLLSKYTLAAFVLMSFVYVFMNRKGGKFFKLDFWLANVFAFLIFLPNIIWNYNNHFVSFVHTSENVVTGGSSGGIKIGDMLEFIASQLIIFGPALVFFVIAFVKDKDKTDKAEKDNRKTLILFSVPLLFAGIVISLFSGAQAHWAAPAYISATIFTVNYIIKNNKAKWLKIILITNIVIFVLCLNVKIPASIASIKKDPLARVNMWYKPAEDVENALKEHPDAFVVSNERKIIAPLMFALRDTSGNPPKNIYKWNDKGLIKDHYDLTRSFTDKSERSVIFISRMDVTEGMSDIYFNVDIIKTPDEKSPFYLYLLKGRREIK